MQQISFLLTLFLFSLFRCRMKWREPPLSAFLSSERPESENSSSFPSKKPTRVVTFVHNSPSCTACVCLWWLLPSKRQPHALLPDFYLCRWETLEIIEAPFGDRFTLAAPSLLSADKTRWSSMKGRRPILLQLSMVEVKGKRSIGASWLLGCLPPLICDKRLFPIFPFFYVFLFCFSLF